MISEERSLGERRQNSSEDILDQLILNIKALMFLGYTQEYLEELVDKKLNNSQDEQVKQFLSLTQLRKRRGNFRDHLLVAVGELVIASILLIAGLAAILPSVAGLTSPQELVNFIGQVTSKVSIQTLSDPIVPALELLLAVLLLLSGFNTVRLAAQNLGQMEAAPRASPRPLSGERVQDLKK